MKWDAGGDNKYEVDVGAEVLVWAEYAFLKLFDSIQIGCSHIEISSKAQRKKYQI